MGGGVVRGWGGWSGKVGSGGGGGPTTSTTWESNLKKDNEVFVCTVLSTIASKLGQAPHNTGPNDDARTLSQPSEARSLPPPTFAKT